MSFKEYVSIVSVDKFYKPDKIIIHCNNVTIDGPYWQHVTKTIATPIEMQYTERISTIGHMKQKPGFITHEADFLKLTLALKEGGIFMDFDAVILNGTKLRHMQEKSECVLGRDNPDCTQLCAGFFSCVPNSTYIREWIHTYEVDYQPNKWVHNAPTHILCSCPNCFDLYIDSQMSNWKDGRANRWLTPGAIDCQSSGSLYEHRIYETTEATQRTFENGHSLY